MQFKSVTLQKYVSAENGGGMNVRVDRDVPSSWETFRVRWNLCSCFNILYFYSAFYVGMHLFMQSNNNMSNG